VSSLKIGFISLGCPKALVDSERILTQLRIDGYEIVPNYDSADVMVVNTCGFIDAAKAESLETIGEAVRGSACTCYRAQGALLQQRIVRGRGAPTVHRTL